MIISYHVERKTKQINGEIKSNRSEINFSDGKLAMFVATLRNPGSEYFPMAWHIFPLPLRTEKGY